ncbi:MAG TPA: FlgD immunoglobulin-like domain containing protein, partial [Syntrophales bacterium]|nr:FlgD immunoglobulin-like domain containing protein [Syntrophales bacterium]
MKLTVWDKAGNTAMSRKRVSWGLFSSITNIYKTLEIFSPNGDGIKDTVELHYRVVEPAHLEFAIYDENDNRVRTFLKDYSAPGDDFITWDGKDENGMTARDGKYKIKVFDYEFFVVVDNTPPDVRIVLPFTLAVSPKGYALDNNFQQWVVEYGEGDNPQEWHEYGGGQGELGEIISGIRKSAKINGVSHDIEWFVGKKFKITAEDYAGNSSTEIADFLTERIAFDAWDGRGIDIGTNSITDKLGLHKVGVVETIRERVVSMTVQYQQGDVWYDGATVTSPPSGEVEIQWDSSHLDPYKAYPVRVKGVDVVGKVYYSNVVILGNAFSIRTTCSPLSISAMNVVEALTLLKFQIKSDYDSDYKTWTDFKIYDSSKGDVIPTGEFPVPVPDLKDNITYNIQMLGRGVSGKTYSDVTAYPPGCPSISLKVNYHEAQDCGLTSSKAVLSAELEAFLPATLKSLSYYIQKPEGLQLLRQFDLSREGLGSVEVDSSGMSESTYPVKAVLSYLINNSVQEVSAAGSFVVDRVLPSAQITYPGKNLMLCPVKVGTWYGMPVEGRASDNTSVQKYELYYGVGENPTQWYPAMTGTGNAARQISGTGAMKGQLGVWNVTDLRGTSFSFKLKVVDLAGNISCYTTSFSIDTLTEIKNLSTDTSLFSPNGDGTLDDVKVSYQIDESATVDVKAFKLLPTASEYVLDSSPIRTILSGMQHLSGTGNTAWDGKGDAGTAAPDDKYGIAVFATDSCGNTALKWKSVEVDNTLPSVAITYPKPGDPLGNLVEVTGTADDLHFQSYLLEAGQGDIPDSWKLLSSNAFPVKNDILGTWNTFGLDGRWTLRLTATDAVGNKKSTAVVIDLGMRKTLIKNLSAAPKLFSPNSDGKLDTTIIQYEVTDACQIKIEFINSTGAVQKTYTTSTSSPGSYTYTWVGKNGSDSVVPDGSYTVKLSAVLSSNAAVTQDETITVIADSTLPTIDIKQPGNNSYSAVSGLTVNGTISDLNLVTYSITNTGDSGTSAVDQASQARENYTFSVLNDLPEGSYTLNVNAKDLGENEINKNIIFTIDRTPPVVQLETPKDGGYYGAVSPVVNSLQSGVLSITGSMVEKNLEIFNLRYGLGEQPAQWTDLLSGSTVPVSPQLFAWSIGPGAGIPDGLYTLSLYAKD